MVPAPGTIIVVKKKASNYLEAFFYGQNISLLLSHN